MTTFITIDGAQKLSFLADINEAFRLPDMAYLHGNDVQLMSELGGDLYFSNYWYGPKAEALAFGEALAQYFKAQYEALPPDADKVDFHGMVMFWDNGDNAMVGSINLEEDLMLLDYNGKLPKGLKKPAKLKQILDDSNDNTASMIEVNKMTKKQQSELRQLILPEYHDEYAEAIENSN